MESISLEFKILPEDYLEAITLHQKKSKLRRFLIPALMVVYMLIYFRNSNWFEGFSNSPLSNVLGFALGCLFLVPAHYGFKWVQGKLMAANFRREEISKKTLYYKLSEDKIHMIGPDSESFVKWSHFTGWSEGRTTFVMFQNRLMYVVPKRRLQPDTEGQLRQLIASKLGNA